MFLQIMTRDSPRQFCVIAPLSDDVDVGGVEDVRDFADVAVT